MTLSQGMMIFLLAVAFGIFGWTLSRFIKVLSLGRRGQRAFTDWGGRIGDVLQFFFAQRSVAREKASYHHLLIFWGFLIIAVGTLEILLNGVIPAFSFELLGKPFNAAFKFVLDITNFAVMGVILYAVYRRVVLKPSLIPMNWDAALILGMIFTLCFTHFLAHGFHFVAADGVGTRFIPDSVGPPGSASYMPIAGAVYTAFNGVSTETAHIISTISYWIHVMIVLFFLNYIPYSKHLHLLGAMPNILLRNKEQSGLMPKLDLEDENDWGVGRYEQFGWKSLLDSYACTECARCSNHCPAFNTDKPLSPMHLVHDIKYEMFERGEILARVSPAGRKAIDACDPTGEEHPDVTDSDKELMAELVKMPPLIGGRIKEETLWACTTCGQCEEICPVFIEHPLKIMQMRTNLVLEQEKQPAEWVRMFRGMENNQNPWGLGSDSRMDWAKRYDIPIMAEKKSAEYLLWIGCAGSFDDRGQKISRDWIALLQQAGVDFAVLGEEEGCTGDAARRAGNEFLFQMMAEANIEMFGEYGVKKILAACPHCVHSFKHEYPAFGGNYEVWHHSQFLEKLLAEGKLKADNKQKEKVVFHDPCYLGRWNKEYDKPRAVLQHATGAAPVELERHHDKSFCCGAGGAKLWAEEEEPYVNVNRAREAVESGATVIGTACPFCNSMLMDGLKNLDKDEEMDVLDIAQVLARASGAKIRLKEEAEDTEGSA
ncbi:MAG: (Fe-S)-binding protein [Deltaproteobacteria bacterium]|nr:(Fe-S)-binding protein [Deltaproteobacteria bacterium]